MFRDLPIQFCILQIEKLKRSLDGPAARIRYNFNEIGSLNFIGRRAKDIQIPAGSTLHWKCSS
jgi:hypothetical protein